MNIIYCVHDVHSSQLLSIAEYGLFFIS